MGSTYYDHYWSDRRDAVCAELAPEVAELFAAGLGPGSHVLDFGCGNGSVTGRQLAAGSGSYVGVDVGEGAIVAARARGLDARLIEPDSPLPFADDEFDLAVAHEVLEHLFSPEESLAELLRILRPGGLLVVTVPNVVYWRRRLDSLGGRWNPLGDDRSVEEPWRDPHVRFFTRRSLTALLGMTGFEVDLVAGHEGGLITDLPGFRSIPHDPAGGRLYGSLRRRFPELFARRLHAKAVKPLRAGVENKPR